MKLINKIFILFFLLFPISIYAQNLQVGLYKVKISQEELSPMKQGLYLQISFYNRLFNDTVHQNIKVRLFGRESDYIKYTKLYHKHRPHSHAFYNSELDEIVILKTPNFIETFFHELSHSVLEKKCPLAPAWLNEGLAEFFEHLKFTGQGLSNQPSSQRINTIATLLRRKYNIPKLMSLSLRDWQALPQDESYRLSWGLVNALYYLNIDAFREIIKSICNGDSSMTAIEKHYPGGYQEFYKQLKKYYYNLED
ncbi:MAG: DUF1570 domain-containing protein [Microscillaceae bacterium]|jgi:hypothetical protein|nr:DUF1570 domain-containing protein [Microscillaceae bacterium]